MITITTCTDTEITEAATAIRITRSTLTTIIITIIRQALQLPEEGANLQWWVFNFLDCCQINPEIFEMCSARQIVFQCITTVLIAFAL